MSNTPSPSQEHAPAKKIGRRVFGFGLAATAVSAALATDEKHEGHEGEEKDQGETPHKEIAPEQQEHLPDWLDYSTAFAVGGAFGYHVLYKGAKEGVALNWDSAADVNGAAGARILALRLLGGEEGKHLAKEEANEIVHGLIPVPVLLALSDATTTNLKIDAEAIFKKVADNQEKVTSYRDIQRPGLGESIEVWQTHLEKVNQDITDKVAQITAICSVFAPLGTTYTSSALANTLKKEVLRMLYEQSYAQEVIQRHRSDEYQAAIASASGLIDADGELAVILKSQVHKAAAKRADELFNGHGGFSNLMLTLSSNIQGTWVLGDPPEIYYAINHATKRPIRVAKAEAVGLANAQFFTLGLTSWWLKKAGIQKKGNYIKNYGSGVVKSLRSIGELVDGDVRSVSFNEGGKFIGELEKALTQKAEQNDKKAQEVLEVLRKIPKAKLQFPIAKYIFDKWRKLQEWLGRVPDVDASDEIFESMDEFVKDPFMDRLQDAYKEKLEASNGKIDSKTFKGMESVLKEVGRKIQDAKAEKLAELLEGMMIEGPSELDKKALEEMRKLVDERRKEPIDPEIQARADHMLNMLTELEQELDGYTSEKRADRIKMALDEMAAANDANDNEQKEDKASRKENVFKIFNVPDKKTLKDALGKITQIPEGEEDAVVGTEKVGVVGEDVEAARRETKTQHHIPFLGLSHSAEEVLFALLTQIPSVPALSRVAGKLIPMLVGVKSGEKPSQNQLKLVISITLAITALISAFADNVAAYMFGEKVLSDFFKRAYGENILEERPEILDNISIATLKVAENAGSLSKIGNGPNFSQKGMMIKEDAKFNQGISIDEYDVELGDTMLWKNHFASVANAASVTAYSMYVIKAIPSDPINDNGNAAVNANQVTYPFEVAA